MHMDNFEVLMSRTTKMKIFSDVTQCKLVDTGIPNPVYDIIPKKTANVDK
jgi:hypothetical protein